MLHKVKKKRERERKIWERRKYKIFERENSFCLIHDKLQITNEYTLFEANSVIYVSVAEHEALFLNYQTFISRIDVTYTLTL